MADTELSRMLVWCGAGVLLCALLHAIIKLFFDGSRQKSTPAASSNTISDKTAQDKESNSEDATESSPDNRPSKLKKRSAWKNKSEYSHPWLLKSLKGHPGNVLHVDFSSNGKYLASTCEDGSVIIWDVRNLAQKEHRSVRVNVELDHANLVAWSPDSKAFVVHKVQDCCIKVYKLDKKKDGTVGSAKPGLDFQKVHEDPVVGFGIASTGKYMMSCSSKTDLVLWDLRGEQLDRLDTYLINTYSAKISPCGRFVVATGFSPDVKVLEVTFSKSGEYKGTNKAYELTGHTSGVLDVAFDGVDTSRIATISKDGTWKLYYTRIDYARGESPYVISSGRYSTSSTGAAPLLALTPNAEVLAVALDSNLEFFDAASGDKYHTVENVFAGPITCVRFDASGKYVLAAGDRAVRIFHNACGYYSTLKSCERLIKSKQTSATMERLQTTLDECRSMLAKLGK